LKPINTTTDEHDYILNQDHPSNIFSLIHKLKIHVFRETSGFRRGVDDLLAVLGFYAASTGARLPTSHDNWLVPPSMAKRESMTLEDGVDRLSHYTWNNTTIRCIETQRGQDLAVLFQNVIK
jgi:hypothetical protein